MKQVGNHYFKKRSWDAPLQSTYLDGNRCFCSSAFMPIRNKKKDGELKDIIVVLVNLISDVFWVFP
jgi:hypothetical protein